MVELENGCLKAEVSKLDKTLFGKECSEEKFEIFLNGRRETFLRDNYFFYPFVITVQATVTLTMCFIIYTYIQSFLNLCRIKKIIQLRFAKGFTLNF